MTQRVFGRLVTALRALDGQYLAQVCRESHPIDFAEFCCSPQSGLTQLIEQLGYRAKRYSHYTGHDFTKAAEAKRALEDVAQDRTKRQGFPPRVHSLVESNF